MRHDHDMVVIMNDGIVILSDGIVILSDSEGSFKRRNKQ